MKDSTSRQSGRRPQKPWNPLISGEMWSVHIHSDWKAHGKDGTLARLARYGHVPAHHARELARDRKAEPRPAVAARGQGISLGEILEQFRLLFGGHADAGVRNGKLDRFESVRHLAHPQHDLPLLRKLT